MTMYYYSVCIALYNYVWVFRTMTDYVCLFKMFLRVYMAMYMFDYV